MNIKGWEIDISALTQVLNREEADFSDYLYESEHTDTACLIHSRYNGKSEANEEFGGACAIYENKSSPRLLFEVKYLGVFPDAFFSNDGNLIFLKALTRYNISFILVLNLAEKSYAVINYSPCSMKYSIVDLGDGYFEARFGDADIAADRRLEHFNNYGIDTTALRFRDWKPVGEGGDLNIQGRGLGFLLANKKKIWEDSLEKLRLGAISPQFFVDINRNKKFYYINIFVTDEYGHTKMLSMHNTEMKGDFFPVFTTLEICIDYIKKGGLKTKIYKASLKNIMKMLDRGYPLNQLGVVVDPFCEYVSISREIRVTPKSLRY